MYKFSKILEKAFANPADKAQTRTLRDMFCHAFRMHFQNAAMAEIPPGNLIPETDKTVLFTGSTISTLKPLLMEETIPPQGIFMIQQCLRTQNAVSIQDESFTPCWSSAFISTGTLSHYKDLDKISALFWSFLTQRLELDQSKIRVHITNTDSDIAHYWKAAGLEQHLVFDTKNPVYYTHKYGIDGVRGRNCNIAIQDPYSNEYKDIGNIIVIETDKKKLAVEMAYGVETAISRILGFPTPIHAAPMAEFLPTHTSAELKITDALAASVLILNAGIKPVATGGRGRMLRRYLQGIAELQPYTDISSIDFQKAAESFEVHNLGKKSNVGLFIVKYLEDYRKLKSTLAPDRGTLNRALTQSVPEL
ncbi:MAG: alanine--tRNA ligase-related protein [Alphaproteobacteria bacterium]|nr:alanine--tRNA ligase-related protein [Alphaproteobacteria bacterium]